MKALRFKTTYVLAIGALALLATACNTGSGSGNGNADPADTTPSKIDLVGTWSGSGTKPIYDEKDADGDGNYSEVVGTDTDDQTIRFNSDGTYTSVSNCAEDYIDGWVKPDDFDSDGDKGTYSLSDTGMLTYRETYDYNGTTRLTIDKDFPVSGWTKVDKSSTFPIAIIGGKLYGNVLTRSGTGTGLEGTWTEEYSKTESSGIVNQKDEYIITSTQLTYHYYVEDASGTYAINASKTKIYSYTQKDAATLTLKIGNNSFDIKFLQSNDQLILANSLLGLTKQ